MPPKKHPETPEEQAKRFREEAERLIKSGELDPEKGEAGVAALVERANKKKPVSR
jgi:hypothetical protein